MSIFKSLVEESKLTRDMTDEEYQEYRKKRTKSYVNSSEDNINEESDKEKGKSKKGSKTHADEEHFIGKYGRKTKVVVKPELNKL